MWSPTIHVVVAATAVLAPPGVMLGPPSAAFSLPRYPVANRIGNRALRGRRQRAVGQAVAAVGAHEPRMDASRQVARNVHNTSSTAHPPATGTATS
jgi:hypothetical protein